MGYTKSSDGLYHIKGRKYPELVGSRLKVWNGTAYKTSGNLTKKDLLRNKNGRIVSKKKHNTEKKGKRLLKHGYGTQKGKFGYVKLSRRSSRSRSHRGGSDGLVYLDANPAGVVANAASVKEPTTFTHPTQVNVNYVGGTGSKMDLSPAYLKHAYSEANPQVQALNAAAGGRRKRSSRHKRKSRKH